MSNDETYVMYEVEIDRLALIFKDGTEKVFPEALTNGRANYILFEYLIRDLAGLVKAKGSDHKNAKGENFEQKAFPDIDLYPNADDRFQVSASSTFPANNNGPKIKKFLDSGDYDSALKICMETGYDKNDFYVLTNTSHYEVGAPFRYMIIPKDDLVANLDKADPRLLSRKWLLSKVKRTVKIS